MSEIKKFITEENKIYSLYLTSEYGFIYVVSNSLSISINDKKQIVGKGAYVILNPYDKVKFAGNDIASLYQFRIKEYELKAITKNNPELAELFMPEQIDNDGRVFESSEHSSLILNTYYKKIRELNEYEQYFKDLQIASWTILLLVHLYKTKLNINKGRKHKRLMVESINTYVSEHMNDPKLKLSDIADNFNVSSSYITNYYKKECGENLMHTIIQARLAKAIEYIRQGRTVQEVYNLVGFNTYTNFFKQFKKAYHTSPIEYVKLHSEEQQTNDEKAE